MENREEVLIGFETTYERFFLPTKKIICQDDFGEYGWFETDSPSFFHYGEGTASVNVQPVEELTDADWETFDRLVKLNRKGERFGVAAIGYVFTPGLRHLLVVHRSRPECVFRLPGEDLKELCDEKTASTLLEFPDDRPVIAPYFVVSADPENGVIAF